MALEAFKMARTSQSKLIAISSNPKTIMLLLIVGSNRYPEVIGLHTVADETFWGQVNKYVI